MGEGKIFSEGSKGKKITSEEKARLLLNQEINRFITEERRKENAITTVNKIGNGKFIDAGIIARLFDIYDLSLDSTKIENKRNVNSFIYGYYSAANTQLNLVTTGIVPGRVISTLEKRGIKQNCDLIPEHILYSVGRRDALDAGIKIEELPAELRSNKFYLQGYKDALQKLQSKGKGSR